MEKYLSLNISEAVAEVKGCKAYVAHCQNNIPVDRKELSLAKTALRSAERELREWQKGIVPPLAEPAIAMVAGVGR